MLPATKSVQYVQRNYYYIQNAVITAPVKRKINWRLGIARTAMCIGAIGAIVYPFCWIAGLPNDIHALCGLAMLLGCAGFAEVSK